MIRVILVQHATPETIIQFEDQLSNELPTRRGNWGFTFKIFRNNLYSVPEAIAGTHERNPTSQFLFTLAPTYLPGSTITIINGHSAGVFCNSVQEEVIELGNNPELSIPDNHLHLGATTGLNDSFDLFLNQKLQSLWTQKQIIKGDGGQIYELENGKVLIKTSNVFMHGSFKGLLVQIEVDDSYRKRGGAISATAVTEREEDANIIRQVLAKYNVPQGKISFDVLDTAASDRYGNLCLQYSRTLDF